MRILEFLNEMNNSPFGKNYYYFIDLIQYVIYEPNVIFKVGLQTKNGTRGPC
jgi:hypothetical protein